MSVSTRISSYENFISKNGKRRKPCPIKNILILSRVPGMINLGEGFPVSNIFPVERFEMHLRDRTILRFYDEQIREVTEDYYITELGLKALVAYLRDYQVKTHQLPRDRDQQTEILLTTSSSPGGQNILFQFFDTILDEGDFIFLENPTSSETIRVLEDIGIKLIGIESDKDGFIPELLQDKIYEMLKKGEKMPKVLYIIPTGSNPSGSTLTFERKVKIYNICSEYNILILEDDPYFTLRYVDEKLSSESFDKYADMKSFLHLDLDYRVVRFDSFWNMFSPAVRSGFVTGPKEIMKQYQLKQTNTSPPSGLQKAVLYQLLLHYGEKGLDEHIMKVRQFYTKKKIEFFSMCEKYLSDLAEWFVPCAGMYCWFKLKGIKDSQAICKYMSDRCHILIIPGILFSSTYEKVSPYVRLCFVSATRNEIEHALITFAQVLQEFDKSDFKLE